VKDHVASAQDPGRRTAFRGQTLVEFALVLPLFVILVLAAFEGGRYVFYSEMLNHATREGARYAIINGANSSPCPSGPSIDGSPSCDPEGDNVKQAVVDAAMGIAQSEQFDTLDVAWSPDNNERGSNVTVIAEYTYEPMFGFIGPIRIEAESTLVINN
jgi:hypothetical protein